jgi:hypothetical protein
MVTRIDQVSGLVYTETMMAPAVGFSTGPSWVHESPFLHLDFTTDSTLGVPTLKHLAMKHALRDQRRLTPAHFENVPWRVASYLWDSLCAR